MAEGADFIRAALLAVHEDGDEGDFAAGLLDGLDGLEGGIAASDDVIEDDDGVARGEVAFDELGLAVGLGGFADGEDLQQRGRGFHPGGHADGEGDRVGAHGEAAHGADGQAAGGDLALDHGVHDAADEAGALGIERGEPAIDVKGTAAAGGEEEIAEEDGFFLQLREEALAVGVECLGHAPIKREADGKGKRIDGGRKGLDQGTAKGRRI